MQVEGGGSCRDGFGGAIRQFRNTTKSCGWKAKGARSEQLMQVKAGGSCRDGFGGAIRQFRNTTKSCGWKAKGARSEQLMQMCSESRWKLQGRFWKSYKKLWLEGQGSQERTANAGESRWKLQGRFWRCYPSVSEPYGSCREGFGGAIRQFRNPTKSCGWKAKGARSEQLMQVCSESRWKLQGRFWRCYPSASKPYKKLRLGQEPVEAAERVLEVLSGSFETLQKAVAGRPREPGASN